MSILDKTFQWNKVPVIGLLFWLTKLISTGQGESISDWSIRIFGTQNLILGAAFTVVWSGILFAFFLFMQLRSEKYRPLFYWLSVALLAIFGTVLSDGLTAVLGVSHLYTTLIFASVMLLSFLAWFLTTGSLSIHKITTLKAELFYWMTVMFSFALGTSAGDWLADKTTGLNPDPYGLGLGLLNTGLLLSAIFVLFLAYRFLIGPKENSFMEILTFWLAYILTRPIGASFADYFGRDFLGGVLGSGKMSLVWLVIFLILMALTLIQFDNKKLAVYE